MPVKKGLVAATAGAERREFGIDDQRSRSGRPARDEQLDLQLTLHSTELVKIKISLLRQISAFIAKTCIDY
jgi:hypothetical protein